MVLIFYASLLFVLYVYVLFPLLLAIVSYVFPRPVKPLEISFQPQVSILIAVHNGENSIIDKIKNCLDLEYPPELLDIVIVSDGSTDKTVEIVQSYVSNKPVRVIELPDHKGKNYAINLARRACVGEIVIMTDISAKIRENALKRILRWFTVKEVGGVCSRKQLLVSNKSLEESQASYLSYDDFIKNCESRIASIAANEGFFYAVRRELLKDIPDGVTDDSYTAMSVVYDGYRFLYDPEARAEQPVRARSREGEIARRRRIVNGSLTGIAKMRALLNPFRYPLYSGILLSHKVLRRFVPLMLIVMFFSTLFLAPDHGGYLVLAFFEMLALAIFLVQHFGLVEPGRLPKPLGRLFSLWYYFCLGNWGTLRGVIDFFLGVRYTKWVSVNKE